VKTISALEMSAIDTNAAHLGVEPIVLMENAGRQVAQEIARRRKAGRVVLLCGPGNNGGDGFVAARHLCNMGWEVSVVEFKDCTKPEARRNREILGRMGGIAVRSVSDSKECDDPTFLEWLAGQDMIVDALLGTGAAGPPRQPVASLLEATMGTDAFKVAVDIPSGLNADTGDHGEGAFRGDLTVTFHAAKHGHAEAAEAIGELVVCDIGIPKEAETLAGPGDLLFVRDHRRTDSHKGQNGTLLIVGGSRDYHGAPAIAGIAAMRTGIDLVYLAVPDAIKEAVSKHSPSLICRSYEGDHLTPGRISEILDQIGQVDAICVGPGISTMDDTLEAVRGLVESVASKPVVLDADGLKAFTGRPEALGESVVATPHGGEFRVLTGKELPSEAGERVEAVADQVHVGGEGGAGHHRARHQSQGKRHRHGVHDGGGLGGLPDGCHRSTAGQGQ
jgi:NAD(P)H-hydrate epimerase